MKRTDLPQIQGKRFDIEALHGDIADLMKQANEGPTFLRRNGRVSYVVMSEELFEELWPDPRRVWGVEETPIRERKSC